MKTIRTAVLAATAALLVMPAVHAGGLGGALGGTVGGAMGGSLGGTLGGGSFGGTGNAAGNGEGRFGAPDLGRPVSRLHGAGETARDRGTNAAGKVRDGATGTRSTADGAASGTLDGASKAAASQATPKHEASVESAGLGSARADRSGADATLSPSASAHAGPKAAPGADSNAPASK